MFTLVGQRKFGSATHVILFSGNALVRQNIHIQIQYFQIVLMHLHHKNVRGNCLLQEFVTFRFSQIRMLNLEPLPLVVLLFDLRVDVLIV